MFQALAKVSCGNLDGIPTKIPQLSSEIFTLIEVAVPVLLVIMGTIDLFKGVAADKEDEMVKARKIFVKRLITGALVFFLMAITKFVVSLVDSSNSGNIMNCVNCFINNDCQSTRVPETVTTTTTTPKKTPEEYQEEIYKEKGKYQHSSDGGHIDQTSDGGGHF